MDQSVTNPVVELSHVSFGYLPHHMPVLDDVSLRIEPRDFLGIIGPNGGGKSTLLKIILGLLKPQQGSVTVFGQPPARVRSRIGYVPQHARIDSSVPASVLDVVLMGRLSRSPWGAAFGRAHTEAAMYALRQAEADDLAKRPIATLSGGQRQRVLIARAIAGDAKLLLLDEPTAGVDPNMERGLTNLLHRLNETLPIVLVSHDISFVSTHLKRIACLNRKCTCHEAHEVSPELIAHAYHDHVRPMQHADQCPLSDPGCDSRCADEDAHRDPARQSASSAEASPGMDCGDRILHP